MTRPCMPSLHDSPSTSSGGYSVPCSFTNSACSSNQYRQQLSTHLNSSYSVRAFTQGKPLHGSYTRRANTQRKAISSSYPVRGSRHLSIKHSINMYTHKKPIKCCSIPPPDYNGYAPHSLNPDIPEKRNLPDRPPRPKRIILVRHGQSEGNVDESAYTRIPDNQIALTETGWEQALHCGKAIRELIESDADDDWSVYFYVSPYKRTLQTLRGIGRAFDRHRIAGVREEPRLREQDFGNFQDREKMRHEKVQRARYGRFFYRFPDGESAADVYDRLTGFRETLRADIDLGRFQRPDARSKNMNLVLVSHGLTLRIFLTRWYKWTVTQFEALNNFANAGLLVMQQGDYGRYSLLVHHTREELKDFGLTDNMIQDQEWQKGARIGELNYEWITSGPSFFSHFDSREEGMSSRAAPPDIVKTIFSQQL